MTKEKISAVYSDGKVIAENSDSSRDLYSQSRYGTLLDNGKLGLSMLEALYLAEKGKLNIFDKRKKAITCDNFAEKAQKIDPRFWIRYCVLRDMRERGYIIKTALKFGADFSVYNRGVKPGEDHAKWLVYAVQESEVMTWHDFAAKNRVAHSTKKKLMIGVVDDQSDVSYWEIRWIKP